MTIYAEESLPVTSATVVQLTPANFNVPGGIKADSCTIVVKTAPIYYAFLSAPTALNGYKATIDEVIVIDGYDNIKNFKAMAQSAAAAIYVNDSN